MARQSDIGAFQTGVQEAEKIDTLRSRLKERDSAVNHKSECAMNEVV